MGSSKAVMAAYKDATSKPYGYLFVDMKQDTPETTRLRTGLFRCTPMYQKVYKRVDAPHSSVFDDVVQSEKVCGHAASS